MKMMLMLLLLLGETDGSRKSASRARAPSARNTHACQSFGQANTMRRIPHSLVIETDRGSRPDGFLPDFQSFAL
jgi:hypothetical protein